MVLGWDVHHMGNDFHNLISGIAENQPLFVLYPGSCTRESDTACRLGGDELVIFMPGISKDKAFHAAERIRVHFETESMRIIDGQSISATISLGIVDLQGNESAESFIERADSAMYAAKQRGKNCSVVM